VEKLLDPMLPMDLPPPTLANASVLKTAAVTMRIAKMTATAFMIFITNFSPCFVIISDCADIKDVS
jgi:hypothetical protein